MKPLAPNHSQLTDQMRAIMRRVWWSKFRRKAAWLWLLVVCSLAIAGGICSAITVDANYLLLGFALAILTFVVGGVLLALKHFNPFIEMEVDLNRYHPHLVQEWMGAITVASLITCLGGVGGSWLLVSLVRNVANLANLSHQSTIWWIFAMAICWSMFFFGLFIIRHAKLKFPPEY